MIRSKTLILHVEDDASQQSLVRITLERSGAYEVHSAGDGDQALHAARARAPQLLLLDLDLPGMDGIAALRGLRAVEGLRDVPVVFLTAAGPERMDDELRSLGVREVLGKPFSPRVLVQTIDRVLAGA
ncbi:MAG TPA: response regulator [Burkholderiales bacterium]|nr:response regulator [Burkholderiales bacterium]